MSAGLAFREIPTSGIDDPKLRQSIADINKTLRYIVTSLNAVLETDPRRGILRVVGPLVPRLAVNPMQNSTFGRPGELAQDGDQLYRKKGLEAEDTDWEAIGPTPPGPTLEEIIIAVRADLFVYSDTKPVATADGPIFWVQTPAPWGWHILNEVSTGVYDYAFFTGNFRP